MALQNIVCPHCFVTNKVPDERSPVSAKCGKCGDLLFTGKPIPVNSEQFKKMVGYNSIPVVVDFWAAWCGPCKSFAPIFEQASQQLEPKLRFLKLDTEACSDIASLYRIQSIPTLIEYRNGKEHTRQSGAMPLAQLLSWLDSRVI
ncbi:MAG: thioredoxin 2 [Candidatus Azotimanducaceae bacterium]|jgi:thioredoxin 2